MSEEIETITYFKDPGKKNTESALKLAHEYAKINDIPKVVIATTKGSTIAKAMDIFDDFEKIIAVTHSTGFIKPGYQEMDDELEKLAKSKGITFLTTSHAFAGVDRAIRRKHGTWQIAEIIAEVYRTFGQGTKVCAEIVLMAADAGLIPIDKETIAVGGTGRGADTVWVIHPANTFNFLDLKMKRCLCKPL
jgi:hypothetical protein